MWLNKIIEQYIRVQYYVMIYLWIYYTDTLTTLNLLCEYRVLYDFKFR